MLTPADPADTTVQRLSEPAVPATDRSWEPRPGSGASSVAADVNTSTVLVG
jgi:hypothetical protein